MYRAQRNILLKSRTTLIRTVCKKLIEEKKAELEKPSSDKPANDILTAILSESTVSFTSNEMVEQLVTFLVAGHETTAGALSWAIFEMCKDQKLQKRLREEVWAHLPASAWSADPETRSTVTAEAMDAMPFLNAFCSEILRFYPPVPATVRVAAHDTTLLGQHIPAGTQVILSPWTVNVNTALWGPDAREFKPERWLQNPSGGCKSNYANLTFLHGPRSCIGQAFARGEFQCLVAALVGALDMDFHRVPTVKKGKGGKEETEEWKMPMVDMMNGISARPSKGWKVEAKPILRSE